MEKDPRESGRTWTEEFTISGRQLGNLIEKLTAKGNARRLIVLAPSGRVIFQVSLTTGVAVAGVLTVLAPVLTALAAMTALLAQVRIRVVYAGKRPPQ